MKGNPNRKREVTSGGSQFYLDLRYHQNTSWQGSIQRLDTGETISFRSALELIALIEETVAESRDEGSESRKLRSWEKSKEVKEPKRVLSNSG